MARGTGLFIGGGVCAGFGLFGTLLENSNHNACNSGIGAFAQGLNQSLARQCTADNTVWTLGVVGIVIGAALLVGGFIVHGRAPAHQPSSPAPMSYPPGWYPDPAIPTVLRWWDGYQWTQTTRPRDG